MCKEASEDEDATGDKLSSYIQASIPLLVLQISFCEIFFCLAISSLTNFNTNALSANFEL